MSKQSKTLYNILQVVKHWIVLSVFADLNPSPSEKITDHKMILKKVLWVNTLKFLEWSKSGKDCLVSHKTSASKHWPGLLCPVNALHSFQHVARRPDAWTQRCWSEWSIPCLSVCLVLWVGKCFCFETSSERNSTLLCLFHFFRVSF